MSEGSPPHCVFEDSLNPDIAWLEYPRAATWNVENSDPGVVCPHELTE